VNQQNQPHANFNIYFEIYINHKKALSARIYAGAIFFRKSSGSIAGIDEPAGS
jgi:hypothetical protein